MSEEVAFPLNYNMHLGESFLHKALGLLPDEGARVLVIGDPFFAGYLIRSIIIGYWKLHREIPSIYFMNTSPYFLGISEKADEERIRVIPLNAFVRNSFIEHLRGEGIKFEDVKLFHTSGYSHTHLMNALEYLDVRHKGGFDLIILLGDPNKLVVTYSMLSNLLHAMSLRGRIIPVLTEVVDKAGIRMVDELRRALRKAGYEIDAFFLMVDPYKEPVKPMMAVLDAVNPDKLERKGLFNAYLCIMDIPGALYKALEEISGGNGSKRDQKDLVNLVNLRANLRFVRFYSCACDRKESDSKLRYVLTAFLEFDHLDSPDTSEVIKGGLVISKKESIVRKRVPAMRMADRSCPGDIICPLVPLTRRDSSAEIGTLVRDKRESRGGLYYIHICMKHNILLDVLDKIKISKDWNSLKENLKKLEEERPHMTKDVDIIYIQEHQCMSDNTLIELYGVEREDEGALDSCNDMERMNVKFFGDFNTDVRGVGGDAEGGAPLDRRDIDCPLRRMVKDREVADVMVYGKRIPLTAPL